MKNKIDILYQDDDLMIVNKAAGMLSIPDRYEPEKENLLHLLLEQEGSAYTVHRIDKDTSGLICFAKNEQAHRELSRQFESRTVVKHYLVLVDGRLSAEEGIIEKGIGPHPSRAGKMVVSTKGKMAITQYKVLETFKQFSLLEADIKTGRTHQIRVHFQAIGHPLAIDPLYGKRDAFYLSEIKQRRYNLGRGKEERPLMSRLTLHAQQLQLQQPSTGETLQFEAPLPKDFRAILNQLGKWSKE